MENWKIWKIGKLRKMENWKIVKLWKIAYSGLAALEYKSLLVFSQNKQNLSKMVSYLKWTES